MTTNLNLQNFDQVKYTIGNNRKNRWSFPFLIHWWKAIKFCYCHYHPSIRTNKFGFLVVINPCFVVELINVVDVSHIFSVIPILQYLFLPSSNYMFFLFLTCIVHFESTFLCFAFFNSNSKWSSYSSPVRHTIILRDNISNNRSKSIFLNFLLGNGICSPPISKILQNVMCFVTDSDKIKMGALFFLMKWLSIHLFPNILDV